VDALVLIEMVLNGIVDVWILSGLLLHGFEKDKLLCGSTHILVF
jgi:hypothetical protein